MVLGVIACSLTDFDLSWTLVNAMRDALEGVYRICVIYKDLTWVYVAHKNAYEKAKILHHNISVSNILITEDGHGLLIDWDLCKSTTKLQGARQSERTAS